MNEDKDDTLHITADASAIPKQLRRDDHYTVPLTVYIGGQRRILGTARIEGDAIEAYIDPSIGYIAEELVGLIADDVIKDVSIAFNAPPATPAFDAETGSIKWRKNY